MGDSFVPNPTDGKEFLPEAQLERLKGRVQKSLATSVSDENKLSSKGVREVRDAFFHFFLSLLHKYRQAIKLAPD